MKINSINGYYINNATNIRTQSSTNTQFKAKHHSASIFSGLLGTTTFSGSALLTAMSGFSTSGIITVASLAGIIAGIKGYSEGKELDKKIDVFEKEASERAKKHKNNIQ